VATLKLGSVPYGWFMILTSPKARVFKMVNSYQEQKLSIWASKKSQGLIPKHPVPGQCLKCQERLDKQPERTKTGRKGHWTLSRATIQSFADQNFSPIDEDQVKVCD